MKTATLADVRDNLAQLLEEVRRGRSVLIVDAEQPVARLEPVRAQQTEYDEARLARLEREGLVRRPARSGRIDLSFLSQPPPKNSGDSVLEALLEERKDGR